MHWKKLHRRTILRGLGASGLALGLPPLDAMFDRPRALRAQAAQVPKRCVLFHFPNGSFMADWTPRGDGAALADAPALQGFADLTGDINVVTGLSNISVFEDPNPAGLDDHMRAGSSILTGVASDGNGAGGPSVDQVAASQIGGATRFSSLVVYASYGGSLYHSRMSWRSAGDPVQPVSDPQQLFNTLFSDLNIDPDAAARVAQMRKSVLDFVKNDIDDLNQTLGQADRAKLDQHLTSIRELEQSVSTVSSRSCALPAAPGGYPSQGDSGYDDTFDERVQVLIDLVAMALRCDLTRVASFSIGSSNNMNQYRFLGLNLGDHAISHYALDNQLAARDNNSPETAARYLTMTRWKADQFAYLLRALKETPEADGTLLDHCAAACFSEMSNGDWHSTYTLPVMVAGGIGNMARGKHVEFPCARVSKTPPSASWCNDGNNTSVSRLWLTMLQAVGADASQFGDANQTLPGLWV